MKTCPKIREMHKTNPICFLCFKFYPRGKQYFIFEEQFQNKYFIAFHLFSSHTFPRFQRCCEIIKKVIF